MRSLASRLVVIGVVQMLLLAITAIVIFIAEGPHEPARPEDYLVQSLIQRLEDSTDDQSKLDTELASLRDHRIEASIYDENRQLVATNVDPPLAIPERRGPPRRPPGGAFSGQGFGGPGPGGFGEGRGPDGPRGPDGGPHANPEAHHPTSAAGRGSSSSMKAARIACCCASTFTTGPAS